MVVYRILIKYILVIFSFDALVYLLGGLILQGSNDSTIFGIVNLLVIGFMIGLPLFFIVRFRGEIKITYWKKFLFVLIGIIMNFVFVVVLNYFDLFNRINSHQEYLDGMKATFILNFLFLLPIEAISILCVKSNA